MDFNVFVFGFGCVWETPFQKLLTCLHIIVSHSRLTAQYNLLHEGSVTSALEKHIFSN